MIEDPLPGSVHRAVAITRAFAEQPQSDVGEHRAKHRAAPFYVQSPTAVCVLYALDGVIEFW